MALANGQTFDEIEIKVPCKPEYVRTIRRTVAEFAESFNMPRSAVEELEIAASEAMANIIRHAYVGMEKAPPVRVKCCHRGGGFTIEITDKGRGFNAPPDSVIPDVDFNREGGLGIILIKSLMDKVSFISRPDEGTRIRMTKSARQALADAAKKRAFLK